MKRNSRGKAMQRVDGYYLYQVGSQIHPPFHWTAYALPFQNATTNGEARMHLYIAEAALEPLLTRSVFRLRTSVQSGQALLTTIRAVRDRIDQLPETELSNPVQWVDVFTVQTALNAFEAVLGAELGLTPLYVVQPKAGFDTGALIESGTVCFPTDVATKTPDALADLSQGTRCIAFELFTAAGFHLHRANEAVLRRYWDAVTNGAQRPPSRNMGDYINEMNQKKVGDERVKAALKNLKDLHRNPLIHPEHSLETADEAIALMNGVHTAMVYMLKEIPAIAEAPALMTPGAVLPPVSTASTANSSSGATS
jgi:hypothetical protein